MMQTLATRIKMMDRWLLVAIGVAVIAVIGIVGSSLVRAAGQQSQNKAQTVKVIVGDLTGSISATGHLRPIQDASLSMAAPGIVKLVKIQVGDQVKAGDVLVQLDDADQQQALEKAKLAAQQAQLSVDTAQHNYEVNVGWTPNKNQLTAAEATMLNAEAAVHAAQSDYDEVAWMPGVSSTKQSMVLQQATNNYDKAKADLAYLYSNRPDLLAYKNNLDAAKLTLSSAQLDVQVAQNALDKTTLRAPFDGTITEVSTTVGEMVSGPVIEMVTLNSLEAVLDVDEVDIGAVDVDQPVSITFDAFPGQPITGKVASISPKQSPASNNDVVKFEVHVRLDQSTLKLRAGMTANATVQTYSLKDALIVPNSAVVTDRASGKSYVRLVTPQGTQKVEVKIGARNGQYTQILSGLNRGDELEVAGSGATASK